MCTIGTVKLEHTYIFKNRDPIRGTSREEWIEMVDYKSKKFLVVKNQNGCYAAMNQEGVSAVGTFVNMTDKQNNYFDNNNLLKILHRGNMYDIKEYLQSNSDKYYGNIISSDGTLTYAFELNGEEVECVFIDNRFVMTNHFQLINKSIRTISDNFIKSWTEKRLQRSKELINRVTTFSDIQKLLSDHEGYPDFSICNHGCIPTATSYIIDCTDKVIFYCTGNPCENKYIEYKYN